MAAKRVLHRARRHIHRRGDVLQADVGVGVVLNESDCTSQYGRQIPPVIETSHCFRTPPESVGQLVMCAYTRWRTAENSAQRQSVP